MKSRLVFAFLFFVGCSASTDYVGTLILPSSGRQIDVVQHRSDSHECVVSVVVQTYDTSGNLIDSKGAEGNALLCQLLGASIQAGGFMGGAALLRPSRTNNSNNVDANSQSNTTTSVDVNQNQVQEQSQLQFQQQLQKGFGVAPSHGSPCPSPGASQELRGC